MNGAVKKVIAFGSFDILHPGHLLYLKRAKSLGNFLIVVVARDSSIKKMKHKEPFFKERDRLLLLRSLVFVDKAVLGNRIGKPEDRYRILKQQMPQVVVFGYDQKVDVAEIKDWLKRNGIDAKVVRVRDRLNTRRYKSAKIRRLVTG